MDNAVPRLLIVSANPPGDGSVNEILLRDFCLMYPQDSLACFAVINPGVTVAKGWTPSAGLAALPVEVHNWTHKLVYHRLPSPLVPAARVAYGVQTRAVQLPALTKRAIDYARQQNIDAVWTVLNSPIIYPLARAVADALNVPLHTSVWDPADRIVHDFKLDALSRSIALREFDRTIRRSTSVAVISEGMRDAYRERYGIEPIVLRHGVHPDAVQPPSPGIARSDELRLGFAGSIYTPDQWALLLSALESKGWNVAGRNVSIRLYGVHGHVVGDDHPRVERMGWLPVEQVVEALASTDVMYLPYRFDAEHEISVRMAFPTKMSTYLATGRPILYHGPFDSTPRRFFDRFPAASCCHSMNEQELIAALERLAGDATFYSACVAAGQRALREELGYATTRRRFAQFVGIPESALRS